MPVRVGSKSSQAALPIDDPSGKACEALKYNQQLTQFADTKAGTLILINSVFIATSQALSSESILGRGLKTGFVVTAAIAVVACLKVVMSGGDANRRSHADLIFFDDIRRRWNACEYARDFTTSSEEEFVDDILRRTYSVAGIAQRKFRRYAMAQVATSLSGGLWLATNLLALTS